jgi:hypothetical protein
LAESRRTIEVHLDKDLAELSDWLGVELLCANFAEVAAKGSVDWAAAAPGRLP